MGHPAIDEMNRCYSLGSVQSQAFRRWQRVLRDEVNPVWDDYQRLKDENEALKAENTELRARGGRKKEPATV